MAESTLSITLGFLRTEVQDFLGLTRAAFATLDPEDQAKVTADINAGLRQFYFPPPLGEGGIHTWSFLLQTRSGFGADGTSNMVGGTSTYALPDNFSTIVGPVTIQTGGTGELMIPVIPEVKVRALLNGDASNGKPKVCAIRPLPPSGATGTRWEILFYPTPDNPYTVSYQMGRIPDALVNETDVPEGGMMHGDTILESCLSIAELRRNDEGAEGQPQQIHHLRFQERLGASIVIDRQAMQGNSDTNWPELGNATTLELGYQDYIREIGGFLGKGWDISAMTNEDFQICDFVVQSGLRQFYQSHDWNFMQVPAQVTLPISQNELVMPADFAGIIDEFTYPKDDGKGKVARVSEHHLRSLYAGDDAASRSVTGDPKYFCIVPQDSDGTAGQGWKAIFYPPASAGITFDFRYNKRPVKIDSTNPFPLGNWAHAETILQSCLAIAEARFKPESVSQREKWAIDLQNSQRIDTGGAMATTESAWPDATTSQSLYMNYNDYARELGGYMGFGYNPNGWTHDEEQEIDFLIQAGLRQVYFPQHTDVQEAHPWGFLEAIDDVFTWLQNREIVAYDDVQLFNSIDLPVGNLTNATLSKVLPAEAVGNLIVSDDNRCSLIRSMDGADVVLERHPDSLVDEIDQGDVAQRFNVVQNGLYNKTYDAATDTTACTLVDRSEWPDTEPQEWFLRENMANEQWVEPTGDAVGDYKVVRVDGPTKVILKGDAGNFSVGKVNTFTTRDPGGDYLMPVEHDGIDGTLTYTRDESAWFELPLVPENRIRVARMGSVVVGGHPREAARRSLPSDGSELQLYELMFWPIPQQEWHLQYRYYIVPNKLSRGNAVPLGGIALQETFLASMMACAELRKTNSRGLLWDQFERRLRAAITKDRRSTTPEKFGYNADMATLRGSSHPAYWRRWNRTLGVTVGGTWNG